MNRPLAVSSAVRPPPPDSPFDSAPASTPVTPILDDAGLASGTGLWTNIQPAVRTALRRLFAWLSEAQTRLTNIKTHIREALDSKEASGLVANTSNNISALSQEISTLSIGSNSERLMKADNQDFKLWLEQSTDLKLRTDNVTRRNNTLIDSIEGVAREVRLCAGTRYLDKMGHYVPGEALLRLDKLASQDKFNEALKAKADTAWFVDKLETCSASAEVAGAVDRYAEQGELATATRDLARRQQAWEKLEATIGAVERQVSSCLAGDGGLGGLCEMCVTKQGLEAAVEQLQSRKGIELLSKNVEEYDSALVVQASEVEATLKAVQEKAKQLALARRETGTQAATESVIADQTVMDKQVGQVAERLQSLGRRVGDKELTNEAEQLRRLKASMAAAKEQLVECSGSLRLLSEVEVHETQATMQRRIQSQLVSHTLALEKAAKTIGEAVRSLMAEGERLTDKKHQLLEAARSLVEKVDELRSCVGSLRKQVAKLEGKEEALVGCDKRPSLEDINASLGKISKALGKRATRETLAGLRRTQQGILAALSSGTGGRWAASRGINTMKAKDESLVLVWDVECVNHGTDFRLTEGRRGVAIQRTGLYRLSAGVYYSHQTCEAPFFQILVDDVPVISATTTEYYCEPQSCPGDVRHGNIRYKGGNVVYHMYDFKTLTDVVSLARGQVLKVVAINRLMMVEQIDAFLQLQGL